MQQNIKYLHCKSFSRCKRWKKQTHNKNNNNKVLYHTKTIKSNGGNVSATIYYITLIIALIVKTLLI